MRECRGLCCAGDPNVHHRKWLKYSNRESLEGQELSAVCKVGLTQLIREPTRGRHLLDLVVRSFPGVPPLIADHKPVTALIKSLGALTIRQDSLADTCWDHIADQSTFAAAQWITDTILRSAGSCVPLTALRSRKSSHPWLNGRSVALVDAKRAPEWTPLENERSLACSAGLAPAYRGYTARTDEKMRCLGQASKLSWRKAKEVMKHEAQVSSTPAQDQRGRLGDGCAGQGSFR